MKHRRAQISAFDFILASSVSVIILVLVAATFFLYERKINEFVLYNDLSTKTFQVSDVLIKSEGVPSNWNSTNVNIIGLASEDRVINVDKLNNFIDLSQQEIKDKMATNYDIYFNLTNITGKSIASIGNPPAGIRSVVIKRYVMYENEEAIMEFGLWE